MKQILWAACLAVTAVLTAEAQNVQLHYDLGRNIYTGEEAGRPKVTLTLEQFKTDAWGAWYYFVDVDMSSHFAESAYTEISREVNLGSHSPWAAHVEYNGGLSRTAGSFQQAALAGLAYNGHSADYARTWSVQLMYKQYFRSYDYTHAYASAQLTGVWGMQLFGRRVSFSGFVDVWRGERATDGHGQLVVMAEPQLWYHVTDHLSVGTEWELSNNFVYNTYNGRTFFWNPTLALKWDF